MFFKKTKTPEENNEAVAKRGIKKMDAIVTGAILGGVVASLYGVKKIREQKTDDSSEIENTTQKKSGFFSLFSKK